jgi:hypothetical protein
LVSSPQTKQCYKAETDSINTNPDQDMSVVQCEVCHEGLSNASDKLCSVECMEEFAAIRGRLFGNTTFKSALRDFADALADYRRAALTAAARDNYAPTAEDQKIRSKNTKALNDAHDRLFAKAMGIGEMIKSVRSPGSARGSAAEGEAVKRAVAVSFDVWLQYLRLPQPEYPNEMFSAVAEAVANYMAGWGNVTEGFTNILQLLRNYSEFSLTTAQEKVYHKRLVDGAEKIGAGFDESHKKHMESLKGKSK